MLRSRDKVWPCHPGSPQSLVWYRLVFSPGALQVSNFGIHIQVLSAEFRFAETLSVVLIALLSFVPSFTHSFI